LRRRSRALPRERPAVKPLRELVREQKAALGRQLLAPLPRARESAALRRELARKLMPVPARQQLAPERRWSAQLQQRCPHALARAQPALEPRQAAPASMKQLVVQPR